MYCQGCKSEIERGYSHVCQCGERARTMALGANIRRLRARRPLMILSRRLGVAKATLRNWESGVARPPAEMLTRIASALGVPVDEILREE